MILYGIETKGVETKLCNKLYWKREKRWWGEMWVRYERESHIGRGRGDFELGSFFQSKLLFRASFRASFRIVTLLPFIHTLFTNKLLFSWWEKWRLLSPQSESGYRAGSTNQSRFHVGVSPQQLGTNQDHHHLRIPWRWSSKISLFLFLTLLALSIWESSSCWKVSGETSSPHRSSSLPHSTTRLSELNHPIAEYIFIDNVPSITLPQQTTLHRELGNSLHTVQWGNWIGKEKAKGNYFASEENFVTDLVPLKKGKKRREVQNESEHGNLRREIVSQEVNLRHSLADGVLRKLSR